MTATVSRASQYWALTKPRVVALIVFTAIIGMLLAIQPGMRGHGRACSPAASASGWPRPARRRSTTCWTSASTR